MHEPTHYSATVTAYASTLLDLAWERNEADVVLQDLAAIGQLVEQNPTFRAFLRDPAIRVQERAGLIQKLFGSSASPLVRNFLKVLTKRGALRYLRPIASAYATMLDRRRGRIEVDVTVPQKLGDAELNSVRTQLSAALKKDALVRQFVDESLIGGMVLRVEDQLIDGSVRTQLQTIREQMRAGRKS
jgi:F-type H+-transporting ATPase subunit delta